MAVNGELSAPVDTWRCVKLGNPGIWLRINRTLAHSNFVLQNAEVYGAVSYPNMALTAPVVVGLAVGVVFVMLFAMLFNSSVPIAQGKAGSDPFAANIVLHESTYYAKVEDIEYAITVVADGTFPIWMTLSPGGSMEIMFDGSGSGSGSGLVEMTLPKNLIADINVLIDEEGNTMEYNFLREDEMSRTISFYVPLDIFPVEIIGTR